MEDKKLHDPKYDEDHPVCVRGGGGCMCAEAQHAQRAWGVGVGGRHARLMDALWVPRNERGCVRCPCLLDHALRQPATCGRQDAPRCSESSRARPSAPPPPPPRGPPLMQGFQYEDVNISTPLTSDNFDHMAQHYDVLVVNFFAPWCPW